MNDAINDFLTPAVLATYVSATGAIVIVCNALRMLTKWNSPWFCFLVSEFIAFLVAVIGHKFSMDFVQLSIIILNGIMLFWSAAGLQGWTVNAAEKKQIAAADAHGGGSIPWLSRWV